MNLKEIRERGRLRRHRSIRKKVKGTPERPRLAVHRSHLHLYAQLIDDTNGRTLASCSTKQKPFNGSGKKGGNVEAAKRLGEVVSQVAQAAGIKKVVFDRGGCRYFGRVKALAEAARANGLEL